jgi:hypothetical protein
VITIVRAAWRIHDHPAGLAGGTAARAMDRQPEDRSEALGVPLATCDARIARSGAAKCAVEVFGSATE